MSRRPVSSVVPAPESPATRPETLVFVLEGDPVPKSRPRVVNGHTYTEARTIRAEQALRMAAIRAGAKPTRLPVSIELRFWRQTARPCDIDNLCKTVMDALNGAAWEDDSQAVHLEASKGIDREHPRTEVIVTPI